VPAVRHELRAVLRRFLPAVAQRLIQMNRGLAVDISETAGGGATVSLRL